MQSTQSDYLPILMQAGLAVGFVVMTIIGSNFLGPKRHSKNKQRMKGTACCLRKSVRLKSGSYLTIS